mmetsp:Transcript_5992/g.19167  ORF Transcript_5992/g.19167 Transcript_5992/m.19167 type:complete len:205 (-) Transcript_5992:1279-1893(-)
MKGEKQSDGSTNNPNKRTRQQKYVNKSTSTNIRIGPTPYASSPPGPRRKPPPCLQLHSQQSKGSSVAMPSTHGPVLPSRFVLSAFPGIGNAVRKKGDGACARLAAGRKGHCLIGQPRRPALGRVASVPGAIWPLVVWRESPHARLGPHARKGVGRGTGHRPEVQRQPERLHPKRGVVLELLLEIDVVFDAVQGEPAVERVVCHH